VADLKGWSVLVAGVRRVQGDPGKVLDEMRAKNPGVFVQAADAQSVYGQEHVIGALQIALEAQARKVMIADKVETELLLRLACTDQISDALKKAGLKKDRPGCLIGFSRDLQAIKNFGDQLSSLDLDDSVLEPSKEKAEKIIAKGQDRVLDYLLERAAIMVRG
jgi:tRNA threonylcarbamoyladenosine modification (KEOPS) complex Cgi121 subunit